MTRLLRTRLADLAEQAIRFGRGNVTRERAAELFADLDIAQPWDEELAALVLSRFSPAEPPNVAGLDWLAEAKADAAVLVREIRDDWENDFSNCPRCGKPRANSWTDHCDTCDGPQAEVSAPAEPRAREFDDAHGCTWRENGEWLTLLDANGKDSGLNKTPAFVEQHYGPLVEVTP